ncbi:unnamed protein product [Amoebophrya sp. A25]|nr:unnamed protein product [Amoebophrya sp. A25]|eukprot:GSA25T00002825001.1
MNYRQERMTKMPATTSSNNAGLPPHGASRINVGTKTFSLRDGNTTRHADTNTRRGEFLLRELHNESWRGHRARETGQALQHAEQISFPKWMDGFPASSSSSARKSPRQDIVQPMNTKQRSPTSLSKKNSPSSQFLLSSENRAVHVGGGNAGVKAPSVEQNIPVYPASRTRSMLHRSMGAGQHSPGGTIPASVKVEGSQHVPVDGRNPPGQAQPQQKAQQRPHQTPPAQEDHLLKPNGPLKPSKWALNEVERERRVREELSFLLSSLQMEATEELKRETGDKRKGGAAGRVPVREIRAQEALFSFLEGRPAPVHEREWRFT